MYNYNCSLKLPIFCGGFREKLPSFGTLFACFSFFASTFHESNVCSKCPNDKPYWIFGRCLDRLLTVVRVNNCLRASCHCSGDSFAFILGLAYCAES